ncbi:MAG: DUF2784 domain-containing protein [Rhodoferax sp.]|nr:DUF2784 domain-containing protein [Rhodoferax sp.]
MAPSVLAPATWLVLADLALALHVSFVVFVVAGLLLVLAGGWRRWRWVRNPWFRSLHLLAIVFVVGQTWLGQVCPLTTLEMWMRAQGGAAVYAGSFIGHWLQVLLYYQAPNWVFAVVYSLFALAVVAAWTWVRPRGFRAAPSARD